MTTATQPQPGYAQVQAAAAAVSHAQPATLDDLVRRPIPLRTGIGSAHDTVFTSSADAQQYYDQTGPGGTNWLLISTASGNGEGAGKFGLLGRLGARVERAGAVALERQRCHRQWHLQQQQRP